MIFVTVPLAVCANSVPKLPILAKLFNELEKLPIVDSRPPDRFPSPPANEPKPAPVFSRLALIPLVAELIEELVPATPAALLLILVWTDSVKLLNTSLKLSFIQSENVCVASYPKNGARGII